LQSIAYSGHTPEEKVYSFNRLVSNIAPQRRGDVSCPDFAIDSKILTGSQQAVFSNRCNGFGRTRSNLAPRETGDRAIWRSIESKWLVVSLWKQDC
jgi:hypothetical protein